MRDDTKVGERHHTAPINSFPGREILVRDCVTSEWSVVRSVTTWASPCPGNTHLREILVSETRGGGEWRAVSWERDHPLVLGWAGERGRTDRALPDTRPWSQSSEECRQRHTEIQ